MKRTGGQNRRERRYLQRKTGGAPRRKNWTVLLPLTAVVILCMVMFVQLCQREVRGELQQQIQTTLQESTEQSLTIVEDHLAEEYHVLLVAALEMGRHPQEQEQLIGRLSDYTSEFGFMQLGFAYPDGRMVLADGSETNVSGQDFFEDALTGVHFVTDTLLPWIDESREDVYLLSVPVSEEGTDEPVGALLGFCQADSLLGRISDAPYEGVGYCALVEADGKVITGQTKAVSGKENCFAALRDGDGKNDKALAQMQADMEERRSSFCTLVTDDVQYCSYMPVSLPQTDRYWYLVNIIPHDILDSQTNRINGYVRLLTVGLMAVVMLFFALYLLSNYVWRRRMLRAAFMDTLTQDDNYASFCCKLQGMHGPGYVISLDLENFKLVNAVNGIAKGDIVLRALWKLLTGWLEKGELGAHQSADNFVLWLRDDGQDRVENRLSDLEQQIKGLSGELHAHIVPRFGVAYVEDASKAEEGVEYANVARSGLKGKRDPSFAYYDMRQLNRDFERSELEDGFDTALEEEEFAVWYQPKCSPDGEVVGAEALVRWQKQDGGQLMPSRFVPVFENNGTITRLDAYMFRRVCRQQKKWQDEGKKILPISVNVSRVSLCLPDLARQYKRILDESGLSPEYIRIEITESAMIDNEGIRTLLHQFHQYGFKILIDDFGTGTASIAVLMLDEIDILKMDKSLIDGIGAPKGEVILRQLFPMASQLHLGVTAEGVERAEQVEFLRSLGCDNIQGFYFYGLLTGGEYRNLLEDEA